MALGLLAIGNNTITGSSVLAPAGDITITGSTVLINEVHNSATQASQTHYRETAATAQLKSGYVDAAKGAYEAVQTAQDAKDDTGSDRMAALATINAAVSVGNTLLGLDRLGTRHQDAVANIPLLVSFSSIVLSKNIHTARTHQITIGGAATRLPMRR